jgi:DNA helicase II / ATP-dependent DNA helicase PcrA
VEAVPRSPAAVGDSAAVPAGAEVRDAGSGAGPGVGPDAVLAALDPEQREVALASRGPVCVLAGAGTGKTRAVTHRIAYAVATGVANPGRVLAVTFTTRAAGELRGRLRHLGGTAVPWADLDRVQARTFHAAALRQLTHFWPSTVGGRPPQVIDSKIPLVVDAARRLRVRVSVTELRDVAAEIEWAKVTQVRAEEYPQASADAFRTPPLDPAVVARVYACYEDLRRERHLVDFESVLELTAAILAEHDGAALAVRDRYSYFVVDEYQDVNPLQKLLLDTWLGDRDDLCVVGDPRQTIYSFTGATPAYLTGFAAEFPGARVIRLVRNYRSTPQVVALANRLDTAAARASVVALTAAAGDRSAVDSPSRDATAGAATAGAATAGAATAGAATAGAATAGAAALVAQRAAGPEPEFAEYADEAEEAAAVARRAADLVRAGTPAREIAVLVRTNAQTPAFEQSLGGVGVPFAVRGAERFFDRPEVRQAVGLLRAAARSASADEEPAGQVRPALSGLGLSREPPAGRGRARERWESLEALAQLADDFFAGRPQATLADLAAELALRSTIGHAPAMDGVTLASLHAAKGLEWDAVFLPGLTDGMVPIVYAQTAEAIEEERRLLYVGITRARSLVCLSWALARSPGGRKSRKPSRFVTEIRPRLRLAELAGPGRPDRDRRAERKARAGGSGGDGPLLRKLKEWRLATAKEQGVPAYVVFNDATLEAIADSRPGSSGELLAIPGVGPTKLDRYGAAVLAFCSEGADAG